MLAILVISSYAMLIGFQNPDCTPPLVYAPETIEDPLYGNDSLFYRRIVQRVHDGERYYDVANEELRQHGFSPDSMFNWRLPTYAWVMAQSPSTKYSHVLIVLLSLLALGLVFTNEFRDLPLPMAFLSVALIFGVINCFFALPLPDLDTVPAVLFQESWACVLISLSVAAYGLGWNAAGVATGLIALFWRELVLPYCLIAAFLAVINARRKEAIAWGIGLAMFAWFFANHAIEISRRLEGTPSAVLSTSRWMAFTGLKFHFFAMNVNAWLSHLPGWGMALYLCISLIGFAGWKGKQSALVGLTAAAYVVAFSVIGKTINSYWGMLYATLLPFGFVRGPIYLWQLIGIVRRKTKCS